MVMKRNVWNTIIRLTGKFNTVFKYRTSDTQAIIFVFFELTVINPVVWKGLPNYCYSARKSSTTVNNHSFHTIQDKIFFVFLCIQLYTNEYAGPGSPLRVIWVQCEGQSLEWMCKCIRVSVVLCISRNIPWSHADYTVVLEFLYSAQF